MRVLVVEDERRLADVLADMLSSNHYTVDIANDGEAGLDCALSGIYDVILLDIMMPKMNGYEVMRRLRDAGNSTPVLMLTAKSDTSDKVTGLDCGADYYLTKPFEMEELLACVRALLRRQSEVVPEELAFGDLTLNLNACRLSSGASSVQLSATEFELMRLLLMNKGNIISKESILNKIWGYDSDAEDNHVEVYISFLRKKLLFLKANVVISAVRKVGYHLEEKKQ